jgi:hypothetical protein
MNRDEDTRMAQSRSLVFRYAEDSKDVSIWHQHQDVLRQLFLVKNHTLKEVKEIMKDQPGFEEFK